MKKTLLIIMSIIFTISCKGQTVSLTTPRYEVSQGAYFKDLDNDMNKFVGTWQYINGNHTLTIVLQKKTYVYNGKYYEDLLVGEYRYESNGVEIVNTLSNLINPEIIGREHEISGRFIQPHNMYPICNDCYPDEKRFMLNFHDSERNYLSLSMVLRYLPQNTGEPEKMTATLISNHGVMIPNENSPTEPRIPYGEYLMIKQ